MGGERGIRKSGLTRERLIRIIILFVILAVAVAGDALRPQREYSVRGIGYASTAGPRDIRTPVSSASRFVMQFDVLVRDDQYDNLVEVSGRSGVSLRLEVQPPHKLLLMVFGIDEVPRTITNGFTLDRWHHVAITGLANGDFDIALDGMVSHFVLSSVRPVPSSAEIGSKNFAFEFVNIIVGSGYSPPRPLNGRINNFSFVAHYVQHWWWPLTILVALGICVGVVWSLWPWLVLIQRPDFASADILIFLVLAGATGFGFFAYAVAGKWAIWLAIGIGTAAAALLGQRAHRRVFTGRAATIVSGLLLAAAAASLITLPNALVPVRIFVEWPLLSAFITTAFACISAIFLESFTDAPQRPALRWVAWIPYLAFALLALRTDSMFAPINALHWDYFVGPIRALREGGWLLWDVPSQYGFLTVLIPSVLPAQHAIDAFYWFQAAAEFAAAAIFYRTLYAVLRVHWLVAFALVVAFFFLGDPLLIGPSPYPSMGAVRFFWCYVLLALAAANFLGARPSMTRFARAGGLAWIIGMLWSAESAVYTSVIYFTPLFLQVGAVARESRSLQKTASVAFHIAGLPIAGTLLAAGVIEAVYFAALGHGPDWSMFIAYSRSYGGGYGERPIPYFGPIWLISLILFGGASIFAGLRNKKIAAPSYAVATALAVVWIVSSYYVGRAYPVIITMLSPLLIFAIFTTIRAGQALGKPPLQVAVAFPFVALLLVSTFGNPGVPALLKSVAVPNVAAWSRLPEVNDELAGLLRRANIDPNEIDDVDFGCANQAGEDNRNVARMGVLLAGFPERVPATTINRLGGSSLDAVIQAARAIKAGEADIILAGGVESMTRAP